MSDSAWRFERPPGLPLPQPDEESQPFFDALQAGELKLQRCIGCGRASHPPQAMCRHCQGCAFDWQAVRGSGTVYSYVVTHQAVHPALRGYTPMATVEVALEEGPRITSNLIDVPPDAIAIGMPVEAVFEDVGEGVVLPLFRKRREG